MRPRALLLLVVAGLLLAPAARLALPAEPAEAGPAALLERARGHFADLRFDEAIAVLDEAIAALSGAAAPAEGEATSTEEEIALLARALDLRAQALFSQGKAQAAESDFERLVRADPTYRLDETTVSPKIVQRFAKIRDGLVGFLSVACDPADAALRLDGRPAGTCPLVERPVLAGGHALEGSRTGFEPAAMDVTVEVAEKKEIRLALAPNARSVIIQTVPGRVEVLIDGLMAGITEPGPRGEDGPSAPLLVEALPPGEHLLEFRKECRTGQRRRINLVVDLLDRSPVILEPVDLRPAIAVLSVRSSAPGAPVTLDGVPAGRTPLPRGEVCAGERLLEVRFGEGLVFRERLELAADQIVEIEARPRAEISLSIEWLPEAAGLLSEDEREDLEERLREKMDALEDFNRGEIRKGRPEAPARGGAPGAPAREGPEGLALHAAIGRGASGPSVSFSAGSRFHAEEEVWRFEAADRQGWETLLERLDEPLPLESPATGMILLETPLAAGPVVLAVRSGSPAAAGGIAPGDVLVGVDGAAPPGPTALRARLNGAGGAPGAAVALDLRGASGPRKVTLRAAPFPRVIPIVPATPARGGRPAVVSYHKAAVSAHLAMRAAPDEATRAVAALNLAAALLHFGEHERALGEALARPGPPGGSGISEGTAHYLRGIALERLGRSAEAAAAFGRAAGFPEATRDDLEGLPIAPAARVREAALRSLSGPSGPSPPPAAVPQDPGTTGDRSRGR